jgi:hypothetical protein
MSATVRAVFGMSSLAAAGSTAVRLIPSRQADTASMSSGVKSMVASLSVLQSPARLIAPAEIFPTHGREDWKEPKPNRS